jgi:hypothetical protein
MMQCAVAVDLDVQHLEPAQPPSVCHLTAPFWIKSRAVEEESRFTLELGVSAHTSAKVQKKRVAIIEALGREGS